MNPRVNRMRSPWRAVALAVVGALLSGAPLWAQSLGAVAREAETQRKTTKSGKVYTNDDLRSAPAPAASPASATEPAAPSSSSVAEDGKSKDDKAKEEEAPKGESYWRERIKAERDGLARAEAFAAALQSQINGLYAEFTACQAPPQCNEISARRQNSIAELERVKKEVEERTKGIAGIQDEARRAGVPAGWVR